MGMVFRIIVAFLLGIILLMIESSLGVMLSKLPDSPLADLWIANSVSLVVGLALAISLMLLLGRGKLAAFGFTIKLNFPVVHVIGWGLGVGILGNLVGLLVPGEGLPFMKEYSLAQMVVFTWIYRSIYEEIICRGFVQGFLLPYVNRGFHTFGVWLSLPVTAAALFFGLMHLMLLTMGVGISTVVSIALFGTILGLIAGYYREKSGSLIPAMLVHTLFNISGTVFWLLTG